ncbi:UDP-N-acetylmuramate dehydrogenase [bacterium]|nr:UDP-N-acetylmuramate dehydrogenase [bacterium]
MGIELKENFDIKTHTSWKIGGILKCVYFPETIDEFVALCKQNNDVCVLGNMSNVLISDFGCSKKIILTSKMDKISFDGSRVTALCGVKGQKLAQEAAKLGLSGLEFLIGFPGSVGGEVYMNASANGQAISDNFIKAVCYKENKGLYEISKDEMQFGYRTSICQTENIKILSAEFELIPEDIEKVNAKMNEFLAFRKAHQPLLNLPNCGSVFKNPAGNSAGKLLEDCGAKNFSIGGAKVWENHANFIINTGNATSTDVLELIYKMQSCVFEKYDIKLEPEVIYLGGNNKREAELCRLIYQKSQK